jgi:hypothetical protein
MSDRCPHPVTLRGLALAAMLCLTLLAGCVPKTNRVAPVPANVVATGGATAITITWSASVGASAYNVKRATASGGPYAQVANTSALAYADSAVVLGTVYYYVVSSVAPDGESTNSLSASASLIAPPLAPTGPVATPGDGQVTLAWIASTGATGYRVKRASVSGGPYTQIATTTAPNYVDNAVTNFTTYFYVISATNVAGESPNSTQVNATPSTIPTQFGTWTNVTPAGVDLTNDLCSNYGATSVQTDPMNPSHLYTMFHCQGVWKSTDYGLTWAGPINTGTNGTTMADCSGGLTISSTSTANPPVIYAACIRGGATGLWKSVDGGVNWTYLQVTITTRQDYYPPVVDPYDQNHLLMGGHEFTIAADNILESFNGGVSWARVPVATGMLQSGRSPSIFFINTGNATTTRGTWLWIGDAAGGAYGTWRTANSGALWTRVDDNEHLSDTQIYQPDNSGVLYMAGFGVLRSGDYGQTWSRVGLNFNEALVFGTPKNVYSMYGFPVGPSGTTPVAFQLGVQPGTGVWVAPGTPAALTQGPAQVAVVNNGTNNILVGAMRNKGIWRYIEP